jgi:hypothetical protein
MKTNRFVQDENFLLIDEKYDLKNSKYLVIFVYCFVLPSSWPLPESVRYSSSIVIF